MDIKPAIIVPHEVGAQNADLAKAQSRLDNSRSYKNLSTVIICPTRGGRSLTPRFVSALQGMMRPMNQMVVGPFFMTGMEVGAAYNAAIEMILANPQLAKFKYVLTVEDDNIMPPDGLLKLYEGIRDYDAVGALYWTKGEEGQPMIYGDPNAGTLNFIPQRPIENTLQRCLGLGMGFTLFRMDVFRKLAKPWFVTHQSFKPGEGVKAYTQDLYAFENMAKLGMKVACDTRVRVGHFDDENDRVW
jgi:hypothetical protein